MLTRVVQNTDDSGRAVEAEQLEACLERLEEQKVGCLWRRRHDAIQTVTMRLTGRSFGTDGGTWQWQELLGQADSNEGVSQAL